MAKVVYKKVKMSMPHCSECGDMLRGVNSIADPYKCSCGTWYWDGEKYKPHILKP